MPSSPASPRTTGRLIGDGPRQKPGAACVRCRAKKLKCDGRRPRCGTCTGSQANCEPAGQVQRGPKKGYLKELQNKIAALEHQLTEARGVAQPASVAALPPPSPMDMPPLELDLLSADATLAEVGEDFFYASGLSSTSTELAINPPLSPGWSGMVLTPDTAGPHSADPISTGSVSAAPVLASQITAEPPQLANQGDTFGSVGVTILPPPPAELFVPTSLLQSDLDQVYFERTHQSVPILHRRHYFSWAQSSSKTRAQNCLQHAIWNSAASLSSHLQPLQESLYQKTQKLLAASNEYPSEALSIEYVQARILMSIHDFMHRSHRQGWLSAGQCFRIVQLMGLHRLDDPLQPPRPDSRDGWIHLEEKRRAFWMAYCVDVLVSKRGMWPLTLHEHVRTTRLPLPDDVFQNDELQDDGHARTQYLHELFESPAQSGQSPFLELIIFCTISRNIASLKRDRLNSCEGSTPTPELFSHHSSLSSTLDQRTEVLQAHHRPSLLRSDPILLFTRMFSHALTLCLCSSLRKTLPTDHEAYDEVVLSWQHRALTAVFGIIDFARSIGSLSYFKMHPFTPLPLAICRDFLNSGLWVSQSGDSQMQELTNLLQDMGGINNVAKDYLAGPELPHVRTT